MPLRHSKHFAKRHARYQNNAVQAMLKQNISELEQGPVKALAFVLNLLAASTLLILMLITCVDVVGRYILNKPLVGSTELTELAVGVVVFSVFPLVSWRQEHIVVDIFDRFFSPKLHFIRTVLINAGSALALYFLGERIMVLAKRSLGYGEVSEYLAIPTGWAMYFIGGMCWMTAFLLPTLGLYFAFRTLKNQTHNLADEN